MYIPLFRPFAPRPGCARYAFQQPVKVQQTLYAPGFRDLRRRFEVGAVVTTVVLAILLRHQPPVYGWAVLAALCMVATHAAFWIWLAPANATIAALKPEAPPANWMALRTLWEYTHAARAVLQIIALGALVYSILAVSSMGVPREIGRLTRCLAPTFACYPNNKGAS